MVKVRFHFVVYTTNHIPVRVEYTTSTGVVCGEKEPDDSSFTRPHGDETEYYVEYDSCGLFLYVNNKTKKIIKKRTWVQDFKRVDNKKDSDTTDYKPKSTIKYINQ